MSMYQGMKLNSKVNLFVKQKACTLIDPILTKNGQN